MVLRFKFEGIDCANCAQQLETKINNLEFVNNCKINFFTEKMILDIKEEDKLQKIVKICKDFEDGVTLTKL